MLTRECKSVLNELKKLTSNTETEFAYLGNTTCFCLLEDMNKIYNYQRYQPEIFSIMLELKNDDYIISTRNEYHFQLTQKAIHPHQKTWNEVKSFLFRSILTPVIVSLITTLLTLYIKTWL